jgi:hypothetical protein
MSKLRNAAGTFFQSPAKEIYRARIAIVSLWQFPPPDAASVPHNFMGSQDRPPHQRKRQFSKVHVGSPQSKAEAFGFRSPELATAALVLLSDVCSDNVQPGAVHAHKARRRNAGFLENVRSS